MTTAFLALHYQNDVLDPAGKIALGLAKQPMKRNQLIKETSAALSVARGRGIAVVHVHIQFELDGSDIIQNNALFRGVYESGAMRIGSWGAQGYDGLAPSAGERVVTHSRVNAFYDSDLHDYLKQLDVETLYMGGVATNSVVEHSARHAADIGYRVVVLEEACATARDDLHAAALENIRLIGAVLSVDDFARHLASL